MLASTMLSGALILCLGLIFWERLWSLELREMNDSLCMVAQRDDFYSEPAQRPYLEVDILNRLGMRLPSDILIKVATDDVSTSWKSNHWPEALSLDQIAWHREDISEFYIQYESLLSKRVDAPAFCDQAHVTFDSNNWHLVKVKHSQGTVYVGAKLEALSSRLIKFFYPSVFPVGVFLIVLLLVCVAWLAKFVSKPVSQLSHAMQAVDRNKFDDEVKLNSPLPELNELAAAYNEMLGKIRECIAQSQRFSADAAHELRTPLTILQGKIEAAINTIEDHEAQNVLIELQTQVSHLTSITRKLLLLSQADAGNLSLEKKRFDWSEQLTSQLNDSSELLDLPSLHLSIEPSLTIVGDPCLLMRLCSNLLANISKYALPNTPIRISSKRVDGMVESRFINTSKPLSFQQRTHLFDRFYRPEGADAQVQVGVGLGLSLAREIARAHRGDLVLENTAEDIVEFKLTLPAA